MRFIGKTGMTLFLLGALGACKKPDYDVPAQRTAIENYLRGQQVEYTQQDWVYKYADPATEEGPVLHRGDSVYFHYSGYLFASGIGALFTTNIEADAEEAGFDKTYMDFSPKGILLGDGSVLRGLELGLPGSRPGETVYLFLTPDLAYGEDIVGVVRPGKSVVFKVVIDRVVK